MLCKNIVIIVIFLHINIREVPCPQLHYCISQRLGAHKWGWKKHSHMCCIRKYTTTPHHQSGAVIKFSLSQRPSWASCQIRKLAGAHAPGMPGTYSSLPRVSDPDLHHGTCVTHVPWCMPGSLTSGFLWSRRWGKTFPAFPTHAQYAILCIWWEAHGIFYRPKAVQQPHKYVFGKLAKYYSRARWCSDWMTACKFSEPRPSCYALGL